MIGLDLRLIGLLTQRSEDPTALLISTVSLRQNSRQRLAYEHSTFPSNLVRIKDKQQVPTE
jgi:hypothetical protein